MSSTEKITWLQEWLLKGQDDSVIEKVFEVAKELDKNPTHMGFSVDGQVVTTETILNRLNEAHQQLKEGKFLTQDELKAEVEEWKKEATL